MSIRFFTALLGPGLRAVVAASAAVACLAALPPALAQQPPAGVTFKVRGANERMEMTVNASRVVEFGFEVPRMMVNNPEIIRVSPISSRSIQISAMRAG